MSKSKINVDVNKKKKNNKNLFKMFVDKNLDKMK